MEFTKDEKEKIIKDAKSMFDNMKSSIYAKMYYEYSYPIDVDILTQNTFLAFVMKRRHMIDKVIIIK